MLMMGLVSRARPRVRRRNRQRTHGSIFLPRQTVPHAAQTRQTSRRKACTHGRARRCLESVSVSKKTTTNWLDEFNTTSSLLLQLCATTVQVIVSPIVWLASRLERPAATRVRRSEPANHRRSGETDRSEGRRRSARQRVPARPGRGQSVLRVVAAQQPHSRHHGARRPRARHHAPQLRVGHAQSALVASRLYVSCLPIVCVSL